MYTNEEKIDAGKMSEVHLWHPNIMLLDAYMQGFLDTSLTIQTCLSPLTVSNSRRFFSATYFLA